MPINRSDVFSLQIRELFYFHVLFWFTFRSGSLPQVDRVKVTIKTLLVLVCMQQWFLWGVVIYTDTRKKNKLVFDCQTTKRNNFSIGTSIVRRNMVLKRSTKAEKRDIHTQKERKREGEKKTYLRVHNRVFIWLVFMSITRRYPIFYCISLNSYRIHYSINWNV